MSSSPSFVVPNSLEGVRVDRCLSMLLGLPRAAVTRLVVDGAVFLDGLVVDKPSIRVEAGQKLTAELPDEKSIVPESGGSSTKVDLIYFDEDIAGINKRAGQVVHPGSNNSSGTMAQSLLAMFPRIEGVGAPGRFGVVHRLDKGTSGLMLFGLSVRGFEALSKMIKEHEVQRTYLALVSGLVEFDEGVIDAPIARSIREPLKMAVSRSGRSAVTHYKVERRFDGPIPSTLLRLTLQTGRTHQIRVHLSAVGHPVIGDSSYKGKAMENLKRPYLHSCQLEFLHPVTNVEMKFEANLPKDLDLILAEIDGLS